VSLGPCWNDLDGHPRRDRVAPTALPLDVPHPPDAGDSRHRHVSSKKQHSDSFSLWRMVRYDRVVFEALVMLMQDENTWMSTREDGQDNPESCQEYHHVVRAECLPVEFPGDVQSCSGWHWHSFFFSFPVPSREMNLLLTVLPVDRPTLPLDHFHRELPSTLYQEQCLQLLPSTSRQHTRSNRFTQLSHKVMLAGSQNHTSGGNINSNNSPIYYKRMKPSSRKP